MLALPIQVPAAKVSGIVKDAADNSALMGVNVTLVKDSVEISNVMTDKRGRFSIESDEGDCIIELSYMGYETIRMNFNISCDKDLGTILMFESAIALGDVTIQANSIIQKVDRQVLLPNDSQISAATDGVSLLQNLQIPRIMINPTDNSVTTLSNEGVQLRINGVLATAAEVKAIMPKDVIRVEYYDQPGVRFGGAAAVIDYIVKKHDSGGSLALAALSGITNLGIGHYYFSGKLHRGKSSFALMSNYSPRIAYWTRSNLETYNFCSGTIENNEVGAPTKYKTNPVDVQFTYNWTNGDKNMLNIRLRNNMEFVPNAKSDRNSYIYQDKDSFAIHDHQSDKSISPSLDIYYQHKLNGKQRIYIDLTGTYINSSSNRLFRQIPLSGDLADSTNVLSVIKGDKYSLTGEAIYEKEWENIMLTTGIRHEQEWVNNKYGGSTNTTVGMSVAETYAFAEMRHQIGKFTYVIGIGSMYTYIKQGNESQSKWIARPQITMSYDFGEGLYWKFKSYMSGYQPYLAQMSAVDQRIDKYQIRRGNPNLRPVMYISNETELSWSSKYVNLNFWTVYSYDHKPIMEDSFEDIIDGQPMIIRTYNNQRGFHRLTVSPSIQVKLLDGKIMFTVAPFINYYVSLGNNYSHSYFNPGVYAGFFALYKGWKFFADVSTRRNNLWGETIEYGEFSHDIGVSYNSEKWSCGLMMLNPFSIKGYSTGTKNLSDVAPNTRSAVMEDFKQVLMLNISMNLDFGSKHVEAGKRINNEDTDNGILSGSQK